MACKKRQTGMSCLGHLVYSHTFGGDKAGQIRYRGPKFGLECLWGNHADQLADGVLLGDRTLQR